MVTQNFPEIRMFSYKCGEIEVVYGLSRVCIKENIGRFDVDGYLRAAERKLGFSECSFNLPTIFEFFNAANQDPAIMESISKKSTEHLVHIIVPANENPNRMTHVISDAGKNNAVLKRSSRPRLINPRKIQKDGTIYIIEADVFEMPFGLQSGGYELEDIDPETGFLYRIRDNRFGRLKGGKYEVVYEDSDRLRFVRLLSDGTIHIKDYVHSKDKERGFRIRVSKLSLNKIRQLEIERRQRMLSAFSAAKSDYLFDAPPILDCESKKPSA